jgi:tRNA (guanine37-N1)-methyltransferase
MTRFDKLVFIHEISLVAIKIPAKLSGLYVDRLQKFLVCRPRLKRVQNLEDEPDKRLILLAESYSDLTLSFLPLELINFVKETDGEPTNYTITMSYDDFMVDDVLRRLLPENVEIPSSFEQVGHIAHLNLKDNVLPYKNIIGEVIMDKNPHIKTVVNKVGTIESEFRTFPMEVSTII